MRYFFKYLAITFFITACDSETYDPYGYTTDNIPILKAHPRTFLTQSEFEQRMQDCPKNTRCKKWLDDFVYPRVDKDISEGSYSGIFDLIAERTSTAARYQGRELAAARFLLQRRLAQSDSSHRLEWQSLLVIDTLWPQLNRNDKLKFLKIIQQDSEFYYASENVERETKTGYHQAWGRSNQLAAALIIVDDPILNDAEVLADPKTYQKWQPEDLIFALSNEAAPGGYWSSLESYLAGDMTYNSALPGTYGGLYDNFGYDNSEESRSVFLSLVLKNGTGNNYHLNNLRDRHKGLFWQVMRVPHSQQQFCLWDTQNSCSIYKMNLGVALTHLYQDPRLKYFSHDKAENIAIYESGAPEMILFYDIHELISPQGPEDLPLATYFSGNGIVAMRENWSNESPYAVFISGEHISRRYGDVNSFGIHRKSKITGLSGGRIRQSDNNDRHHWYARHSISKNILTVCDPQERVDYDGYGKALAQNSGKVIATHHNLCGQKTEEQLDSVDGNKTGRRPQLSLPEVDNMGDIIRFEQQDQHYAYALGDGQFNYSSKVKQYHRAFTHLSPNTFIVYDRVETSSPDFKTAILFHSPDRLAATMTADESGAGVQTWQQPQRLELDNLIDYAAFQTLLPKERHVTVRGGRTLVLNNASLIANSIEPIEQEWLTPRQLEISAFDPENHNSMSGVTITINGDSEASDNDSETITFNGEDKEFYSPLSFGQGERDQNSMQSSDDIDPWYHNQWAGWLAKKSSTETTIVTGNNLDTLMGDFSGDHYWQCKLYKFHANSSKRWRRITSISTNKDIAGLDLGVSHFFDVEDVSGKLHSFMPDSDGKADRYRLAQKKFGRYTAQIIDTALTPQHHFLTAITVSDSGTKVADASLLESEQFYGAVIDNKAVLFSKLFSRFDGHTTLSVPTTLKALIITDLAAEHTYYIDYDNGQLIISSTDLSLTAYKSSANGIIYLKNE